MSTPARPTAPVRQGIQLEHVLKELEDVRRGLCQLYGRVRSAETKLTVLYNNDYASTSKARKRLSYIEPLQSRYVPESPTGAHGDGVHDDHEGALVEDPGTDSDATIGVESLLQTIRKSPTECDGAQVSQDLILDDPGTDSDATIEFESSLETCPLKSVPGKSPTDGANGALVEDPETDSDATIGLDSPLLTSTPAVRKSSVDSDSDATLGPDGDYEVELLWAPGSQYDGPIAQSIPVDRGGNPYVPDGFKLLDVVTRKKL